MRSVRRKTRLEKEDERATSKEWRDLGYLELKIEVCNHAGWPDRWYAAQGLGIKGFWCEWKSEDGPIQQHQLDRHEELRQQGETVIVARSRREFWGEVRKMQAAARL